MIKLIIADGNDKSLNSIAKNLKTQSDIEIIGLAKNGDEVLTLIKENKPDVILLDIILPKLDGFQILKHIKEIYQSSIKTIVMSGFANDDSIREASHLGASYFYVKPVNNDDVISKIRDLYHASRQGKGQYEKLENRIAEITQKLGVPPHIKGYTYIREAIKMIYENPEVLDKITKVLYPTIAEKFKTTPTRVERAIRHAVQVAWITKKENETIQKMFSILHKDKPTNSQFVATIVEKLRIGE